MQYGRNDFNWDAERWNRVNSVVHDEAAKIRVARRALPLFGHYEGFVDSIVGHQVSEGPPLSIRSGQNLVPVELSAEFQLSPEQFNDEQVAIALATRAVYRIALAEDAVILLGAGAKNFLKQLNVWERNLDQQKGLLANALYSTDVNAYEPDVQAAAVASTGTSSAASARGGTSGRTGAGPAGGSARAAGSAVNTTESGTSSAASSILESILDGRRRLQKENQHGEYCVIVSPDRYQEAFRPRQNTLDAPVYEIRPLLKEGGFLYSDALTGNTGVMFSLGGDSLDLAVPVDAMAEFVSDEKVVRLRIVEQFRLRVNDPTATVVLN